MLLSITDLHQSLGKADLLIVYDGECPFCTQYVKLMKLRTAVGTVDLVDARSLGVQTKIRDALGLDLNDGMMALYGDRYYVGSDALFFLATITSRSNAWNTVVATVFQNATVARILYPALRTGRNAALFLLGRKPITDAS